MCLWSAASCRAVAQTHSLSSPALMPVREVETNHDPAGMNAYYSKFHTLRNAVHRNVRPEDPQAFRAQY